MNKDKQIEEMAKILAKSYDCGDCTNCMHNSWCPDKSDAELIYNAGYRKIYDDHQRQCTCYALGCQMAEQLERKVAAEFIAAVDSMLNLVCEMTGLELKVFGKYAELKKKYIGKDTNVATNTEET